MSHDLAQSSAALPMAIILVLKKKKKKQQRFSHIWIKVKKMSCLND